MVIFCIPKMVQKNHSSFATASAWTIPCHRLEKGRKGGDVLTCLSKELQNFVSGLRKAAKDKRAL